MGWPTETVKAAFGSNPNAASLTYVDGELVQRSAQKVGWQDERNRGRSSWPYS